MDDDTKPKRRRLRAVLSDLWPASPRGTVPWPDLSDLACPSCQGSLDRRGFCPSCSSTDQTRA